MSLASSVVFLTCLAVACFSLIDAQCTTQDLAYGGNDILVSGRYNKVLSWEACQVTCQAITNCTHWTWFETGATAMHFCELKTAAFALPLEGAVSGPRNC